MSLETAMNVLNTPTPEAPVQPQAISPKEIATATVEQEASAKNTSKEASSEGVVVDPVSPTKIEEPASAKFAALSRKEAAIVKRDQELKARDKSYGEREAKIAERESKIKRSEELWDKDVFAALEARGYTYQKLTDLLLSGESVAPESKDPAIVAKKTIDDFKKEMAQQKADSEAAQKKAQEDADNKQKADLEAAWEAYKQEINEHIDANKDDYELISLYGQQSLVADTVNEFYEKNKRVLSVKEASDLVENYLVDEAKKALGSKKLGTKSTEAPKKSEEPRIQGTKTLNNSMQPTSASTLPVKDDTDRMKRALAALGSNNR